jgi:protein TonB
MKNPYRLVFLFLLPLVLTACATGEIVQPVSQASSPSPVYPAVSRRLGEEGRVILRVRVLANGEPGEVRLHKSSGIERLDAAAVAAMKQTKFNPARARWGRAVDSWVTLPVEYVLK